MSASLKATAAITTGVVLLTVLVYNRTDIADYYNKYRGIEGICRYIWIGDYLPPSIRASLDDLDEISQEMIKCEWQLERIDILVQRALLESVDGSVVTSDETKNIDAKTKEEIQRQIFQHNPELRKDIGFFSTRLDRLAARIDSVLSHSDEEVKKRKKKLSNSAVSLMESLDEMIASLYLSLN